MKDIPTISYDEIHPDFLNSEQINMILVSNKANLENFRDFFLSNGIIDFSRKKVDFAQNLSTIHFDLVNASNFIDLIYSKGKFELGLITIIIEDNVSIKEIHEFIYKKEQKTLNLNHKPQVRAPHIEHNKFIHIKFIYNKIVFAGYRPLIAHFTSYGVGTVKSIGSNKTQVDISVIIQRDSDYPVFRDAIDWIFYEEFGNGKVMRPLNIPINKEQVNLVKQTYIRLVKELEIKGLNDCEIIRYGDRDDKVPIFLRPKKFKGKDYDFEDIDELIEKLEKGNWLIGSLTFSFLDDLNPNYLIRCSYQFRRKFTTVKFISSKYSDEDFDEILIDPETKRRTMAKMKEIEEEELELDKKFYILHRLITYLKDTYYENLE